MTQDIGNLAKFSENLRKLFRTFGEVSGNLGKFSGIWEVFKEFRKASDVQGLFFTYFPYFSTYGESFAFIFNVSRRPGMFFTYFRRLFVAKDSFSYMFLAF